MQRLLPALLFALCSHALLLLLPYSEKSVTPPYLPGEKSIRISLSEAVTAQPENRPPESGEEEQKIEPPPLQEKKEQEIQESILPEEPVVQQQESVVPVALQPQSVKKKIHPKPVKASPTTKPTKPDKPTKVKSSQTVTSNKKPEAHEIPSPVTVEATPLYQKNPKPGYPPLARRRNWEGTVVLSVTVSEQGSVNEIILHKSSGHELLDKTALKTVKKWEFIPGHKNGQATIMEVLVPVHFKLN